MPTEPNRIARSTLARYAGLLGRGSIAAQALDTYDGIRATGNGATIKLLNNGFEVWRGGVREYPRPVRR